MPFICVRNLSASLNQDSSIFAIMPFSRVLIYLRRLQKKKSALTLIFTIEYMWNINLKVRPNHTNWETYIFDAWIVEVFFCRRHGKLNRIHSMLLKQSNTIYTYTYINLAFLVTMSVPHYAYLLFDTIDILEKCSCCIRCVYTFTLFTYITHDCESFLMFYVQIE